MKFSGVFILILFLTEVLFGQKITDYNACTGWGRCKNGAKEVIILRKFDKGDRSFYLALSPQSLQTSVISTESVCFNPSDWAAVYSRYSSSPYIKALKKVSSHTPPIQDAGFVRFSSSGKGIHLTIDLCPSARPLDRIVFTDLITEFSNIEKPVPVAVSVTGQWMNKHPDDLNWLLGLVKSGDLSILWVNHSYNHFVSKKVPLTANFLLKPGTDIGSEVLNTEIALLEKGIVPTIFFRFPGLVSNQETFNRIVNFGLITVGSDAWLAKGQWPSDGSIVLIHANGNEPVGVAGFLELIRNKKSKVLSRQWELFDLRESLVSEESR